MGDGYWGLDSVVVFFSLFGEVVDSPFPRFPPPSFLRRDSSFHGHSGRARFNESEFELLVAGVSAIDVDDWEAHTRYNGYTATSPQVVWLWRVVRAMSREEKALLLQFATGTATVPPGGFKHLRGFNGEAFFNVQRVPLAPVPAGGFGGGRGAGPGRGASQRAKRSAAWASTWFFYFVIFCTYCRRLW